MHGLEGIHPGAHPVGVGDVVEFDLVGGDFRHQFGQRVQQADAVDGVVEQRGQLDRWPDRRFAGRRLEDGVVFRIEQGHRQGAQIFQREFDALLLVGVNGEGEFYPGHGQQSSVGV